MTPTEAQKKLAKLFILNDLLIQEIDDPMVNVTDETKAIYDKSIELQELLIPVVDQFYQSKTVSQSTFFLIMQDKFNYIFDKEYK
jgi:hypothetical protein